MSGPSWLPDPAGRHQYRWWDGGKWTEQVADYGAVSADEHPLGHDYAHPGDISSTAGSVDGTGLPDPLSMVSSKGRRVGAHLLDGLLGFTFALPGLIAGLIDTNLGYFLLGLGIVAYFVWVLYLLRFGQTPGKLLLGMRVVRLHPNRMHPMWGWMFVRIILLKAVLGSLPLVGIVWFLVNSIMMLVDDSGKTQAVWDRMLNTVVVDDYGEVFHPRRGASG